MDLQDIIKMVKTDIENTISKEEKNLDVLVADITATSNDNDDIIDQMATVFPLYEYLSKPGSILKIFESDNNLELGECLIKVAQLPWAKNEEYGNIYLEAAYYLLFRHFDYGNELEKRFAADSLFYILRHFGDELKITIDTLLEISKEIPLFDQYLDKEDYENTSDFFIKQIQYALIPYINYINKMYPHLEDETTTVCCNELENCLKDKSVPVLRMLPKARLLYNFIEIRIKQTQEQE